MPIICRPCTNQRAKLCMYPDHVPPHFHLLGPGWSAMIRIDTLAVIRGRAPATELREALAWARANKQFLAAKWAELNERD